MDWMIYCMISNWLNSGCFFFFNENNVVLSLKLLYYPV